MSLINQMLQDLDSRRAANGPNCGLPNEVRPLPAMRRSSGPLIVGAGVAALLVAGGLVWQQADQRAALERRIEAALPRVPESAAIPVFPTLPDAAALPSDLPAADDEAHLRLTTSLRVLPERESLSVSRTIEVSSKRAALAPQSPSAVTVATNLGSAVQAASAVKSTAPMMIEKSAPSGSPHERAEGEYRKALGVLNAGRLNEAIEGLRAALRQDGAHSASRQLLFKLMVENKRFEEAAEALHDGLQLQPAQTSWAMSLGRLQVDRGDLSGAWQTLQRSLPFAANSADYQGFSAHVLQRLGRNKDAVERYQSATRLAPAEGRWWLGLGLVLEADGQSVEARDALLRARASGTLNAELIALVDQKLR